MPKKKTYQEVKDIFASRGCVLLSDTYENNKQKLSYKCVCGSVSEIRLDTFTRKDAVHLCKNCKESRKEITTEKIYGTKVITQSDHFLEKAKKTWIETRGVDNPSKDPDIKKKISENTDWDRHRENSQRAQVDFHKDSEKVREKFTKKEKTELDRYGMQYTKTKKHRERVGKIFNDDTNRRKAISNRYKTKSYTWADGTVTYNLQGYEPQALALLEQQGFRHTDLDIPPRISYTVNNESYFHFPDLYMPEYNKMIEVKSEYTFFVDHDKVLAKCSAAQAKGYDYSIWVLEENGQLLLEWV